MAADINRTIDAVWRMESARIIACVARMVRDVGIAEELAHDVLVTALEQWPAAGVPQNAGAWLMTAAKHRALDWLRRGKLLARKHEELGRELEVREEIAAADAVSAVDDALDDEVGDDLLRLVFIACHPVLPEDGRVALTLRLLGGLSTDEIARAFLVPEATIAQRIVRAKRKLAQAHVAFEVPAGEELARRLSSVLEVLYLIFNEGYSATAGEHWMRPQLCQEALRLARILAGLMPLEPEVLGLVALMEIQASRLGARTGPSGKPILLMEQNRARWDRLLIGRGLAALARAEQLAGGQAGGLSTYALQAAIAACHARARTAQETDWTRIVALYEELATCAPSAVVELNRAVALSMADGPAAGLAVVDSLAASAALEGYHLLPAVRGDLLVRLGRPLEAAEDFRRAAAMTRNATERRLMLERASACAPPGESRSEAN